MKRTLSAIALSVALIAGGATSAQAKPYHIDPRELGRAAYQNVDPVMVCERYLTWADRKHTEARADRAVIVCGRTVRTERQAKRLYAWAAHQSAYIRDLIG